MAIMIIQWMTKLTKSANVFEKKMEMTNMGMLTRQESMTGNHQ
jgi:hypothetical protein